MKTVDNQSRVINQVYLYRIPFLKKEAANLFINVHSTQFIANCTKFRILFYA